MTLTQSDFKLLFGQPVSLIVSFTGYILASGSLWRVLVNDTAIMQDQNASSNTAYSPTHYYIFPLTERNSNVTIKIQGKSGVGTVTYVLKDIKVTARIRET